MKSEITLTWSKLMALLVLLYAFTMDVGVEGFAALMYALPFVVILIGGKQVLDRNKKEGQQ